MWTVLLDPIYGLNVGVEYVEDEEEDGYAIIFDFFVFRVVVIKN